MAEGSGNCLESKLTKDIVNILLKRERNSPGASPGD